MKNKCSNKIALRSGNSPYIIACSIPHQTNTLAHNTHTHTRSLTLWQPFRCPSAKYSRSTMTTSTATTMKKMKKKNRRNLEFRFNIGDLFLFGWHFSDVPVCIFIVVVVHPFRCASHTCFPCYSLSVLSVSLPLPCTSFVCCFSDSCCRFPFRVMIHTAYQNEMSRKNDRIKISTTHTT